MAVHNNTMRVGGCLEISPQNMYIYTTMLCTRSPMWTTFLAQLWYCHFIFLMPLLKIFNHIHYHQFSHRLQSLPPQKTNCAGHILHYHTLNPQLPCHVYFPINNGVFLAVLSLLFHPAFIHSLWLVEAALTAAPPRHRWHHCQAKHLRPFTVL